MSTEDLDYRSISDRILSLAGSMDGSESDELKWIAEEIRELERQLEETTTIRRFGDAVSSSLADLLEETLSEIDNSQLHKRELAWFLYINPQNTEDPDPEDLRLITMTSAAGSLRMRCDENRTELDLHELDNFVLKGHQELIRERINEALTSACNSIEPVKAGV